MLFLNETPDGSVAVSNGALGTIKGLATDGTSDGRVNCTSQQFCDARSVHPRGPNPLIGGTTLRAIRPNLTAYTIIRPGPPLSARPHLREEA